MKYIFSILLCLPLICSAGNLMMFNQNPKPVTAACIAPGAGNYTSISTPAAWWKINEGTGTTLADASGNGFTATITGSPTWIPVGCTNWALSMTSGDSWSAPVPISGVVEMTICCKVYYTGSLPANTFFLQNGSGNGFGFLISDGSCGSGSFIGILVQSISCNASLSTTTMPQNQWVNLIGIVGGGGTGFAIYVNGSLSSFNPGVSYNAATGSFVFTSFTGYVADVRVFARALSPTDIALYQ